MLFSIYRINLGEIIRHRGIEYELHVYADDTQLCFSFDLSNPNSATENKPKLERCISEA